METDIADIGGWVWIGIVWVADENGTGFDEGIVCIVDTVGIDTFDVNTVGIGIWYCIFVISGLGAGNWEYIGSRIVEGAEEIVLGIDNVWIVWLEISEFTADDEGNWTSTGLEIGACILGLLT